jgi:UDP-glucose 4-epimerase
VRVTVTGASGFVGNAICHHLHALGWSVRGVVRRRELEGADGCEVFRGDLRDDCTVRAAMRNTDLVVHAAGLAHVPLHHQAEAECYAQNVAITEHVARAAADHGARMVYISSEAATSSHTPYGRSKRLAEERLEEMGRLRGLRWTIVRPALLFGERDPGNFLRLILAVARGRFVYVDGGRARKSLTHVGNVGPAVAAIAASTAAEHRRYHLADPHPYTVREIVRAIAEQLGVGEPRYSLPGPCARALGRTGSALTALGLRVPLRLDIVDTLTRDVVVDPRPLQEETGYSPPIPFREGLVQTIEWCRRARLIL